VPWYHPFPPRAGNVKTNNIPRMTVTEIRDISLSFYCGFLALKQWSYYIGGDQCPV